jgi:hypothetical protein
MARSEKRLILLWAVLVGITALSWGSAHGFAGPRWQGAAVIVLALIKVRFVILDFMEVRHAPALLRLALEAWVVLIGAALVGMLILPQG